MRIFAAIGGSSLVAIVLADAFETIVVARRAQPIFRITRLFYQLTWAPVAAVGRHIRSGERRERFLSLYGPLSLLILLGSWVSGFILGFALLQWTAGLQINGGQSSFMHHLYFSATTFFMLAFHEGSNPVSKVLTVAEAALGFTFLGLVIGYPPLLYQHFSSREMRIAVLDARAGTPPSAAELVIRQASSPAELVRQLAEWELWEGEVLQSQLSYPMLAYFRSQHTNQSWLATLTAVVDTSALILVAADGDLKRQAQFTFALGRHALVDLALVFRTPPFDTKTERLSTADCLRLRETIAKRGLPLQADRITESELRKLRDWYEPFANALSQYFLSALPPWIPAGPVSDNWQRTTWDRPKSTFAVSDPFRYD